MRRISDKIFLREESWRVLLKGFKSGLLHTYINNKFLAHENKIFIKLKNVVSRKNQSFKTFGQTAVTNLNFFHFCLSFGRTEVPHFLQIVIAGSVDIHQDIFVLGVEVVHLVEAPLQLHGQILQTVQVLLQVDGGAGGHDWLVQQQQYSPGFNVSTGSCTYHWTNVSLSSN